MRTENSACSEANCCCYHTDETEHRVRKNHEREKYFAKKIFTQTRLIFENMKTKLDSKVLEVIVKVGSTYVVII